MGDEVEDRKEFLMSARGFGEPADILILWDWSDG